MENCEKDAINNNIINNNKEENDEDIEIKLKKLEKIKNKEGEFLKIIYLNKIKINLY